jgi:pimeloyl-ACP methyl ester carboxylesterase
MELNPSTTAVIAVHLQHDVVSPDGAFCGFFAEQVVERDVFAVIGKILTATRAAGGTVVYTRVAWRSDFSDLVVNSPILAIVSQSQCLVEGSDKAQIVPELTPAADADDPSDERIRARLECLMADPATVTDELVAIRRTIYARPGFAGSMRHILCLQDPDVRRRNLITDEELAAVPHGAMVVWTSNDPSGPAATGVQMAEKIRGGRFEHVTDAGHWPQWEQRERFNHLVLDFLAEPAPAEPAHAGAPAEAAPAEESS